MNRRTSILAIALLCASAANSSPASAAEGPRAITFHAYGSFQTYDMSDVNAAVRGDQVIFPGAVTDIEPIESGAGFGGGFRVWPNTRLFVSLEVQRLLASNPGSASYLGSTYTGDLRVPATGLAASVGYVVLEKPPVRLAISGGPGYYFCTGGFEVHGAGFAFSSDLEGSGFGVHGIAHVLTRLTPRLDLELGAGYRYARTTDVTSAGYRIENPDGSPARIDWSGPMARAGLSFRVGGE